MYLMFLCLIFISLQFSCHQELQLLHNCEGHFPFFSLCAYNRKEFSVTTLIGLLLGGGAYKRNCTVYDLYHIHINLIVAGMKHS